MTRLEQEPTSRVKNELKVELNELEPCDDAVSREAVYQLLLNMASSAYGFEEIRRIADKLPSVNPQPCDDAISREDATAEFIKWQTEVAYAFGRDYLGVRIIQSAIDTIRELPSVTQKSGKWQPRYDIFGVTFCSECGFELKINNTNFCPNCGAKMESEE